MSSIKWHQFFSHNHIVLFIQFSLDLKPNFYFSLGSDWVQFITMIFLFSLTIFVIQKIHFLTQWQSIRPSEFLLKLGFFISCRLIEIFLYYWVPCAHLLIVCTTRLLSSGLQHVLIIRTWTWAYSMHLFIYILLY